MKMMMKISLTSLVILSIFCSLSWALFQQQMRRRCPRGYVKCQGSHATRRCILDSWVCDGENDCGNNFDEKSCEGRECPDGKTRCKHGNRCISDDWFCDGDNDCGDWSDEPRDGCPPLTCSDGELACPSGHRRCISEHWLCDGDNDCGDNSDENSENCETSGHVHARKCFHTVTRCAMPIGEAYRGMDEEQILEKIRNTDLSETCGPVLKAQECASEALDSESCQIFLAENENSSEMNMAIESANITVNFICRDHVVEMNQHKDCLLRPSTEVDDFEITYAIGQQCAHLAQPTDSHCPSQEALDCVLDAVSGQCGEETANDLRALSSEVLAVLDCTKRKRSNMLKKEIYAALKKMRRAFPSLF